MYEDSHTRMAVVEYADAIKTVSGALTKINKKSPHAKDQKMVLGTHRKAATSNPNCSRIYLRGLSSVSYPVSQTEDAINARLRFAAVSAAVKARRKDLSHMAQDLQAFNAQKDSSTGKKTMTAYLWYVCGQAYDAQQG